MRHFLFLQGPHGKFFKRLGNELLKRGNTVSRINLCGGDWLDWHGKNTCCYREKKNVWSSWISHYYDKNHVTDLLVFGDWRPMHDEAIVIAKLKKIRVWVFEEGYLRPAYITMERNGVNGRSDFYVNAKEFEQELQTAVDNPIENREPVTFDSSLLRRKGLAFNYAALELLAHPFFPFYQTHRPNNILVEGISWLFKLLRKRKNKFLTMLELKRLTRLNKSFFLFPLQLDSDSQVRLYSPFSGMKNAIMYILASFAEYAPKNDLIIIRNHPMDNGIINYREFIESFSKSIGIYDRVFFLETGNAKLMIQHAKAMVVLNSTIGMTGVREGLPVYCVGSSIYALKGLAADKKQQSLDEFWSHPVYPEKAYVDAFESILKKKVLINGGFYDDMAVELSIPLCIDRLLHE